MRTEIETLPSPFPIARTLPGIYEEQHFLEQFCGSLDDVLAPVISTLDNLSAYLDVRTAPADFLPWLAYWIGLPAGLGPSAVPRREVLKAATTQQGWQGTAQGMRLVLEAVFGCPTSVGDPGGVSWSHDPEADLPDATQGSPGTVVVTVTVPRDRNVEARHIEALLVSLKPAHLDHRVEIIHGG